MFYGGHEQPQYCGREIANQGLHDNVLLKAFGHRQYCLPHIQKIMTKLNEYLSIIQYLKLNDATNTLISLDQIITSNISPDEKQTQVENLIEELENKISDLELQYVLFHRINYMLLDRDILKVLFKYNKNKSIYLVDCLIKNDDDYSCDLVDEEFRYVLRR